MNLWRWTHGRRASSYGKFPIIRLPFFDVYLLRYPTGSYVGGHTDAAQGRRHYRLNIVLREAKYGGVFQCADPIIDTRRLKLFRADKSPHAVSLVVDGTRLVLSIGIAL